MKKKYGLLGKKLGHSYSKIIHKMLGYEYRLIEKNPGDVSDFISAREFDGLNVTIPYKKTVMGYCDKVSDLALRIGAVNTLYFAEANGDPSVRSPNGRDNRAEGTSENISGKILCGTNTDYEGLRYTLDRAGISLRDKKVLILGGTGGAGSMAKVLAADNGASQIIVASRMTSFGRQSTDHETDNRVDSDHFSVPGSGSLRHKDAYRKTGILLTDYDHLPLDADIIINATPIGTYPDIETAPVDLSLFKSCSGVCDLIYNPLRTALLMQADKLGIPNTNGLPMLVRQAAAAAEFFHGNVPCFNTSKVFSGDEDHLNTGNILSNDTGDRDYSDSTDGSKCMHKEGKYLSRTEDILSRLEKQAENIVLIGMPGCGKSSIGKILAKRIGRKFKDSDKVIREMFGRTPAEMILQDGEAAFREKEAAAIASLAKEHSLVIATGGGAVQNQRNVDLLRQNGRIFFIDRDPDLLSTFNRPLSQNGGVYKIYDERYPIYSSCCDHKVKNNGEDFSVCAGRILAYFR